MERNMKFQNGDFGSDLNMTSLQGYVETSYADLVACFGEPVAGYDDYKCDCEWNIKFADGVVCSIYNWKDGKNYCGEEGLEVQDITDWHIGGHRGTDVVGRVKECLGEYLARTCYQEPKQLA
jgi:hypothetical protein